MPGQLRGKVALVTGGTGALGTAVVRRFLDAGARVHATFTSPDRLGGFDERVDRQTVTLHPIDLTDEAAVAALFDEVIAADARLDVLVNVAGGFAAGPVVQWDAGRLDRMLAVNLKTCFFCCRQAARVMGEGGRIVNVGAQAAVGSPKPKMVGYVVSKAGVAALTQALAVELAPLIAVNAVLPAAMDTPANRRAMPKADFGKWTPTEAVAEAIAFLASDAAHAVTGALVPV